MFSEFISWFQNINWLLFFQPAAYGNTIYLSWLWDGMKVTLSLAITAWLIAFICGSIVGIIRTLNNKFLLFFSSVYVEIFRNVPLIVQMFVWYLVGPQLLPEATRDWFLQDLDPNIQFFITASICLGLFTSARVAEQVRSGIESLPIGQKQAASALGFTLPQTYCYVLLPNAYRKIIPPMTSEMTNIIKNSSVASIIGLIDLIGQLDRLIENTNRVIESLLGVTIAFVIINYSVITIMHYVEKKTRLPNSLGG